MTTLGLPLAVAALAAAQTTGTWMPPQASRAAAGVDSVFALIFWICLFFLVLILAVAAYFTIKYRARSWHEPAPSPAHHTGLELTWSIIPTLIILGIFGVATTAWVELMENPSATNPTQISVTAKKWSWWFDYPDGTGATDLHVMVNEPIKLVMSSEDVLHSLYIPAFRAKQDIVPGRYTYMAFEAIEPGVFPIKCAEFCGMNHSLMLSKIVVHADQADYDKWAEFNRSTGSMPLIELGEIVYKQRGCFACHSIDGKKMAGPTFKGIWGIQRDLADGSSVLVDENYLRESIIEPKAKMVVGYLPVMPPTALQEREFAAIITYIKSLKD